MEEVLDCKHNKQPLTWIVNIEEGAQDSTTYQCKDCKEMLTVKPMAIGIGYGRPEKEKE